MSSDLCILLTDNEPGLFIKQALAAMSRADSARHSKRPALLCVQYDALSYASL